MPAPYARDSFSHPHVSMSRSLFLAVLLAVAVVPSVQADDVLQLQSSPAEIRSAQDALKGAVERKEGDFAGLSDEERQRILDKQAAIYALIEGKQSAAELGEEDKRQLVNALEEVKALVTRAEDERMVCQRVRVIGSNRPENKCMTVRQRREMRERLQTQGGSLRAGG